MSLTAQQFRTLALGTELNTLNLIREGRAAVISSPAFGPQVFTPAALAGYLMGTAELDKRRRQLRVLLADELACLPAHNAPVAVDDRFGIRRPRHAR
jgi:hypothetical protein